MTALLTQNTVCVNTIAIPPSNCGSPILVGIFIIALVDYTPLAVRLTNATIILRVDHPARSGWV
jgi:hypothetical protein